MVRAIVPTRLQVEPITWFALSLVSIPLRSSWRRESDTGVPRVTEPRFVLLDALLASAFQLTLSPLETHRSFVGVLSAATLKLATIPRRSPVARIDGPSHPPALAAPGIAHRDVVLPLARDLEALPLEPGDDVVTRADFAGGHPGAHQVVGSAAPIGGAVLRVVVTPRMELDAASATRIEAIRQSELLDGDLAPRIEVPLPPGRGDVERPTCGELDLGREQVPVLATVLEMSDPADGVPVSI
jgi:hypothetical protein